MIERGGVTADGLSLDPDVVAEQLAADEAHDLTCDPLAMEREVRRERLAKRWRPYGMGASDIPKLMIALRRREWQPGDPGYLCPDQKRSDSETRPMRSGVSRFLLQKAGLVNKLAKNSAMIGGERREPELFETWRALRAHGQMSHEFEATLIYRSIGYAMALPREWPPLVDRECPRLVARLDAWARDIFDDVINVQLKCARYQHQNALHPVWWDRGSCPWWHAAQCQAEMAISNARHALLVVGCGWLRDAGDPRGDGPVRVFYVERDEAAIAEIRDAVREGWARVEALREAAAKEAA